VHTHHNDVPLLDVKTPKVEHFQGSHYGRQSWCETLSILP